MKLVVTHTPNLIAGLVQPPEFRLDELAAGRMYSIGRDFGCQLVVGDGSVSPQHAMLTKKSDGTLMLSDLGTGSPTFCNDKRCMPYQWVTLVEGDELRFGRAIIQIAASDAEYARPLAVAPARSELADLFSDLGLEPEYDKIDSDPASMARLQTIQDEIVTGSHSPRLNTNDWFASIQAQMITGSFDYAKIAQAEAAPVAVVAPTVVAPAPPAEPIGNSRRAIIRRKVLGWFKPGWDKLTPGMQAILSGNYLNARMLWVYLGLITLAELLTAAINTQSGLVLHASLLIGLILQGTLSSSEQYRRLALALTVAPLIRLLSLSLPLHNFSQLYWYPMVAVPLLLAAWMIGRQLRLTPQAVGLRWGDLRLQLMLAGGGFGLGAVEYAILQPRPILSELNWPALILGAFSLMIFTGFNEEIIFRGLLQTLAMPALKKWGLFYVSLLFSVLHIGYLSVLDLIFVFAVGLLFGYIVFWCGSIFGVLLAHGFTNITMFLIMPYLSINPNPTVAALAPWCIGAGVVVSLAAVGILFWQNHRRVGSSQLEPAI